MSLPEPTEADITVLETITLEDVLKIEYKKPKVLPNIPVDSELLEESLAELDKLVGLKNVKKQIRELIELVQYYKESGQEVLQNFSFHTVFVGNPGTGKTTVARILTRIYKALGVLERGHMIETDRQGLVAGFVGQTAIKTAGKVDEALGGVLFIDEAYALTMKKGIAQGDFGDEAIQALLKRMEDRRGEFFVFAAGYPENMDNFLKANPGLNSRFDKVLKFEDYSAPELMEIADYLFQDKKLSLTNGAREHLLKYFNFIFEYRDQYFGNARTIRGIVDEIVKNQNLRLSKLPIESRKPAHTKLIKLEDLTNLSFDTESEIFTKKRIGFGSRGQS